MTKRAQKPVSGSAQPSPTDVTDSFRDDPDEIDERVNAELRALKKAHPDATPEDLLALLFPPAPTTQESAKAG